MAVGGAKKEKRNRIKKKEVRGPGRNQLLRVVLSWADELRAAQNYSASDRAHVFAAGVP